MAAGDQQTDPPPAVQAHDPGQLRRHVPRGQPQCVRPLRKDHAPRLLGAQLRLPAELLLQRIHESVCTAMVSLLGFKKKKKSVIFSWVTYLWGST